MARPQKHTADYFSHDADASGRKTLRILFNHFGHEGISAWWQLLENISSTENHVINIGNPEDLEDLASTMRFSPERLREILDKAAYLGAIDKDLYQTGMVWSQNLVDRLAAVYKARGQSLPLKPSISNPVSDTDNGVSLPDNATKESKEKETKEENSLRAAPGFDCCYTYSDYRNLLDGYENQVGFLIGAFQRLHHDAPASDFEDIGGRLGKIWANNNRDTGFILKVMCEITTAIPGGSHLSFLQQALEKRKAQKPHGNGQKPTNDPDRYHKGKYGHMVQR